MLSINPTCLKQTGLMQILKAIFRSNLAIISQKGGERYDGYSCWSNILPIEMLINPKHVSLSWFQIFDNKNIIPWNSDRGRQNSSGEMSWEGSSKLANQADHWSWLEQVLHNGTRSDAWGGRQTAGWQVSFDGAGVQCVWNLGYVCFLSLLPKQGANALKANFVLFFARDGGGVGNSPSVSDLLPYEQARSKMLLCWWVVIRLSYGAGGVQWRTKHSDNFILVSKSCALHPLLPPCVFWTEISFQIVQSVLRTYRSIYKMELPEIIMVINI